ncbi:unnamed protein product [Amoebophrya sp. A120]|nr:unnamed protein product [Amoebophrya sp. A120]|eukprot:GSA120T00019414001.1
MSSLQSSGHMKLVGAVAHSWLLTSGGGVLVSGAKFATGNKFLEQEKASSYVVTTEFLGQQESTAAYGEEEEGQQGASNPQDGEQATPAEEDGAVVPASTQCPQDQLGADMGRFHYARLDLSTSIHLPPHDEKQDGDVVRDAIKANGGFPDKMTWQASFSFPNLPKSNLEALDETNVDVLWLKAANDKPSDYVTVLFDDAADEQTLLGPMSTYTKMIHDMLRNKETTWDILLPKIFLSTFVAKANLKTKDTEIGDFTTEDPEEVGRKFAQMVDAMVTSLALDNLGEKFSFIIAEKYSYIFSLAFPYVTKMPAQVILLNGKVHEARFAPNTDLQKSLVNTRVILMQAAYDAAAMMDGAGTYLKHPLAMFGNASAAGLKNARDAMLKEATEEEGETSKRSAMKLHKSNADGTKLTHANDVKEHFHIFYWIVPAMDNFHRQQEGKAIVGQKFLKGGKRIRHEGNLALTLTVDATMAQYARNYAATDIINFLQKKMNGIDNPQTQKPTHDPVKVVVDDNEPGCCGGANDEEEEGETGAEAAAGAGAAKQDEKAKDAADAAKTGGEAAGEEEEEDTDAGMCATCGGKKEGEEEEEGAAAADDKKVEK